MGNAEVTVTVTFTEDQAKAWLDGVAYARLRGHGGAELPEDVEDALYMTLYEAVDGPLSDEDDEDDWSECGCGLWICHDCRPEHPIHGDTEAQEMMKGVERHTSGMVAAIEKYQDRLAEEAADTPLRVIYSSADQN